MERVLSFFFVPLTALAVSLSEINDLMPEGIDFFLKSDSFLESSVGKLYLNSYRIVPLGGNLYRLEMHFKGKEGRHKQKLFGFIKVEIVGVSPERELSLRFWYRKGRFLFFETPNGIKTFDTFPRCYFRKVGEAFEPTFKERWVELETYRGKLRLNFEFTNCGF